jgi:hypothetical protein
VLRYCSPCDGNACDGNLNRLRSAQCIRKRGYLLRLQEMAIELSASASDIPIFRQPLRGRQLAPDFRPRGNGTLRSFFVQLEPELQRVE